MAQGQDIVPPLALPRPGILPRVIMTWRAPRRIMRAQQGLSDASLLVILLLAMIFFFLAQLPMHNRAAWLDPSIPLDARVGGALVGVMFVFPLLAYGVAALIAVLSRGRISGHASRVALFWSLMAISPAMLLCGLVEGYLGATPGLMIIKMATFAAFLWFWLSGFLALRRPA